MEKTQSAFFFASLALLLTALTPLPSLDPPRPRPQGFSLKKWVGPHPFFEGKALGTRLSLPPSPTPFPLLRVLSTIFLRIFTKRGAFNGETLEKEQIQYFLLIHHVLLKYITLQPVINVLTL